MASSSDWVSTMTQPAGDQRDHEPRSSWLNTLLDPCGFVEGLPIARAPVADLKSEPIPPPATEAADPLAQAFARGEQAGRAAVEAELDAANAQQRALRLTFRNLDQAAIDCLASELSDTVIALCEKAFADFEPDQANLIKRCREAAQRLGAPADDCRLHLNPADIALIDAEMLEHWQVVPDDSIARAGLRFESADGSIGDGPSEWLRAIAAAIRG